MSRRTQESLRKAQDFQVQGYHLLWPDFPDRSPNLALVNFLGLPRSPLVRSYNPGRATLSGLHTTGLGSSHFARRYSGSRYCFPFLEVLRCFSSLGWPPYGYPGINPGWVSPFGNPRIYACLTAPRGLSQPTTSFIASWHQGIHHVPLVAWSHLLERTLSSFARYAIVKDRKKFCAEPCRFTAPGGDRIRTDDLLRARQLLSQLSYAPGQSSHNTDFLVGLERFELSTSRLSGVRSNRLSYSPTRTSLSSSKITLLLESVGHSKRNSKSSTWGG